MLLKVEGSSAPRRKFVEGFARLIAKQLKIENCRKPIVIFLKKGVKKEYGYNGVTGLHDGIIGVGIDTGLDVDQTMLTLAHEMVHVKQIAKGTLKYFIEAGEEVAIWRGKRVDTDNLLYVDRPWELEAYSKQEVLVRRICGQLLG